MAGIGIQIEIQDQAVQAALLRLLARAGRLPMADIGMELVNRTQERFLAGKGPDGQTWAPHAAATLARKKAPARGGHNAVLIASGLLMRSITYLARDQEVEVGSNRVYARIHQLGGQAGRGHRVRIPARPYLGVNAADETAIGRLLQRHLGDAL